MVDRFDRSVQANRLVNTLGAVDTFVLVHQDDEARLADHRWDI